uniref:Uncharacterized protein n=1 Tax=Rhizophora mucronata TaxID=61149 RepID=A0A2P2QQB9_RHIMU
MFVNESTQNILVCFLPGSLSPNATNWTGLLV